MNRSLVLVGCAREQSTRLPKKMIKPFADTTLFKIYLDKFNKINELNHPFDRIIMGINKNDKILWEMTKNSNIDIIERSDESVSSGFRGVFNMMNFLYECKEEYAMHINGCFPLLKVETIIEIGKFFKDNKNIKSLICVKENRNIFWDEESHNPIGNIDSRCMSTSTMKPLLENVNHIIIFNINHMLHNNSYWDLNKNKPHLYHIKYNQECLDIDIPLDFDILEQLCKREEYHI